MREDPLAGLSSFGDGDPPGVGDLTVGVGAAPRTR